MDIQTLLDAVSKQAEMTRSQYHLTLGALEAKLAQVPSEMMVEFDHGGGVGREHSYRGYYSDLAFSDRAPETAAALLRRVRKASGKVYEGYKGGDFTMGPKTPLWNASYGSCGLAIVDAVERDGKLILVTKSID